MLANTINLPQSELVVEPSNWVVIPASRALSPAGPNKWEKIMIFISFKINAAIVSGKYRSSD